MGMQIVQFIEVEQCTNLVVPFSGFTNVVNRGNIMYFTSPISIEVSKGIDDMVQTAHIKLPKRFNGNVFKEFLNFQRGVNLQNDSFTVYSDNADPKYQTGKLQFDNNGNLLYPSQYGNLNIFAKNIDSIDPNTPTSQILINNVSTMFQRGDMITIYIGYLFDEPITSSNNQNLKIYQQFRGYIASVNAGETIELSCEDYMWYFRQLRIPNKHYNANPELNSLNSNYGTSGTSGYSLKPINYIGLDNHTVQGTSTRNINSSGSSGSQTISYSLTSIPYGSSGTSGNPQNYLIDTLPGVLFDALNNTNNDQNLISKGIYPLIWTQGSQLINGKPGQLVTDLSGFTGSEVPKPVIVLADQGIRSAGNINIENNASIYSLLELYKEKFNETVYFLQQSPSYNMGLDNHGLPIHNLWDAISNAGYPGYYLNLGYSEYVPTSVYQPQNYTFFINGANANIISSNLIWKRQEDFSMGAIIKSTELGNTKDEDDVTSITSFGAHKQKIRSSSVLIGDQGGSVVTYYYGKHIKLVPWIVNGQTVINKQGLNYTQVKVLEGYNNFTQDSNGNNILTPGTALYNMATWGYEKLNSIHYTGYYGTITIFGFPFVNIGDIITIIDQLYPERTGSYKVRKTKVNSSIHNGVTQELTLHYQVNFNTTNSAWQILQTSSNNAVYYNNTTYYLS